MSAAPFVYLAILARGVSIEVRHRMRPREQRVDILRSVLKTDLLEPIPLGRPGVWAYCDAEGIAKGLPVNPVGSALIGSLAGARNLWVGTLLVIGRHGPTIASLTDPDLESILALLKRLHPTAGQEEHGRP